MKKCFALVLLLVSLSSSARADERFAAQALRAKARKQLIWAAVLMPVGAALIAGGAGLIVDSLCFDTCDTGKDTVAAEVGAGVTLSVVGYGAFLSSFPLLISGCWDDYKAKKIELGLSAAPLVGRGGFQGATAMATLRF